MSSGEIKLGLCLTARIDRALYIHDCGRLAVGTVDLELALCQLEGIVIPTRRGIGRTNSEFVTVDRDTAALHMNDAEVRVFVSFIFVFLGNPGGFERDFAGSDADAAVANQLPIILFVASIDGASGASERNGAVFVAG